MRISPLIRRQVIIIGFLNMLLDVFEKLDGMLTLIAKEKMPHYLFPEIVNWRIGEKIGRFIKRDPYTELQDQGTDANLAQVQGIIEFTDKNDSVLLVFLANATLRETAISGGSYGISSGVSGGANDERTAGSTIAANIFNVLKFWNELRAGAGNVSTERPWWHGYIAQRKRFNDSETISAGKYLDEMYPTDPLSTLFTNPYLTGGGYGQGDLGLIAMNLITGAPQTLSFGRWGLYAAPVFDGYQRGLPKFVHHIKNGDDTDATANIIHLWVDDSSDALKLKRITHIDLFMAYNAETDMRDEEGSFLIANWFDRVDLNEDSSFFLEKSATNDNATAKITVTAYADWLTFNAVGMFIYDRTNDSYHRVTAQGYNATDVEFTVTPAPTTGSAEIAFCSRWWTDNISGTDYYHYVTFHDDYYHRRGSEMYSFLRLPKQEQGLGDDLRFKYSAWNGNRQLVAGFGTGEKNRAYYSALDSPDVIASLNRINAQDIITGVTNISKDFLIFTIDRMERHYVFGNENSIKDLDDIERGLVDQKALVKVHDDLIAGFDYKGPWLLEGRRHRPIGEELSEWWNDNLSKAQKDACVTEYNFIWDQIWFSFPTYTDSYYTTGIVFVFDLRAERRNFISPWWILKSPLKLNHFCRNYQNHLIAINEAAAGTKLVDFDDPGTDESVETKLRLKMLQNPLLGRRVIWHKLRVDIRGSARGVPADTVTCKFYFDEEASASLSLSLNMVHMRAIIKYISETMEAEITTPASTNAANLRSLSLTFTPKRL